MLISSRHRVFISSVMEGYEAFRDAAAEGIRRAGCEPVRAENFPAAFISPRNACLDGIRSADAVILLLGSRYGWVAPSGISATEEEYNEARRTHNKRIFVFLEDVVSREPRQEEFVQKVQDYIGGHWRKIYSEPDELAGLIQETITASDLVSVQMSENVMAEKLKSALALEPPEAQGVVWLKIVWRSLRDEEVIDPLMLGDTDFHRTIMRLGHESDPPLFAYEHSKSRTATASALCITQGDATAWRDARDLVKLELNTDGTLSIVQNISATRSGSNSAHSLFNMYFLEPEVVRERLARAWAFAVAWWEHHDPYRRHDPLLYGVALHDVGTRYFRSPETSSTGGITIPPKCPNDPLIIYDYPRRIARASFAANAPEEIERIYRMIEMRFREWENRW
ncbi:MAG: hypothetical protein DRH50_11360 [Deltaproteobacteria bacterium]|nr:MAG: hypothetical protein DRH50_11360 [Deltaproteobacteria bacterium]